MRALIKKADAKLVGEAKSADTKDTLVATLVKHVQNKRAYTELFETPEATESWAIKHRLPDAQRELLLQMQAHKDIFVPNAYLDVFCTAIFLAECAYIAYDLHGKNLVLLFLGMLFITDAVISRVKATSQTLGRALSSWLFRRGFVDTDPLSGKIQMKKWTEQSWQLFVHVAFSLVELRILSDEGWYEDPAHCWIPHPFQQIITGHRTDLTILYLAQLAIWVYTCLIHRFWDERRKDYFVMYVHHIVTIMLVGEWLDAASNSAAALLAVWPRCSISTVHTSTQHSAASLIRHPISSAALMSMSISTPGSTLAAAGSFAAGYLRIGLLVLWVHDVSDILVDLLKMVNYLKLEERRGFFASELAYFACICGWVYWRLYQYPFRVIRGALIEPYRLYAPQPRLSSDGGLGVFMRDMPLYAEMNALLLTLLALHVYWAFLLFMVGYRIITESAREASRQEYEGDSDDEQPQLQGQGSTPTKKLVSPSHSAAAPSESGGAAEQLAGAQAPVARTADAAPPSSKGGRKHGR